MEMGLKQAKKIVKILEQARKTGTPVVAMCDSNGARVGEGAAALEAYADVFAHMARLSGVVPMISLRAACLPLFFCCSTPAALSSRIACLRESTLLRS